MGSADPNTAPPACMAEVLSHLPTPPPHLLGANGGGTEAEDGAYLVCLADLNEPVLGSRVFVFVRMPETETEASEDVLDGHFITSHTQLSASEVKRRLFA